VQTAIHVSTGITGLGSDVGSRLPLVKTMTTTDQQLVIQGSSLKGCIRSVYEAITNSTLAVIISKYRDRIPPDRLPCKNPKQLCPASRVFGALDWQGLVEFSDSICQIKQPSIGFMPSLYSPRPDRREYFVRGRVAGRKFYYNMTRAVDRGESRGIPVQQASRQYTFKTKNLLPEELGILFLILGQDKQAPIALKVGGGKPIGMGTMTSEVTAISQAQNIQDRYRDYATSNLQITGSAMQQWIQTQIAAAKRSQLLEKAQWQQVADILKYPGTHEPPEGMY
ncbi:MAG: RAMP superfamily CRISPR-associated protein, partial [Elainella sp. Prado103]|nr:RAMP superfamily CRISPR-associated protein [Elainella sp. Prado103]